jgi:hypothetical protein
MELNPIMAGIVANPILHLSIKAVVLLAVLTLSPWAEQRLKGAGHFLYGILIAIFTCVIINNVLVLVPRTVL